MPTYYASSSSSSGRFSLDGVRSSPKDKSNVVVHKPSEKSKSKDKQKPVVVDKGGVCPDKERRRKDGDSDYYY